MARVGLAIGAVALVVLQLPDSAWSLAIVVVFAAGLLGVLWVPAGLLLTAGAELIDLDDAYAFAFFNLAWAGGFTLGAAGGGALAQVTADAVPYLAAYALLAGLTRGRVRWRVADRGRRYARYLVARGAGPIADLELDLEVFSGPVRPAADARPARGGRPARGRAGRRGASYLDFLEGRGELDLEAATEFLVLIAALLELKSRLMLPREEDELLDLEPGEAAEELLARMLEARRYRRAAEHLANRLADEDGHRFRAAPLPPALRRVTYDDAGAVYEPAQLGAAIGGLLRVPAAGQPRPPHRPARHRRRAPGAPALAAAPRRLLVRRGRARAPTA